jgi:hypothetical protein
MLIFSFIYLPPPAHAQAHPAHAQAQAHPPPLERELPLDTGRGFTTEATLLVSPRTELPAALSILETRLPQAAATLID